jgi:DNA helicase-2/ATP-dependent DNA helicase PcrA
VLSKYADKLREFAEIFEGMRDVTLPSVAITQLFERSGYRQMLVDEGFEGETKIENVEEFISAAVEYEKRCEESEIEPTMSGFLEEISLISDVDKYDSGADAVVLMTVHSAKGLEFPIVFLAGMEDGIFPSMQNIGEPSEMSEERRLAYVAITRAKEQLYITHVKNRLMYGKSAYNPLSRFIKMELPPHLIEYDRPRPAPPRVQSTARPAAPRFGAERQSGYFREFNRPVDIGQKPKPQAGKSGAAQYGIERYSVGQRVRHATFGEGTVLSSRDMGGDVLYEVRFDTGETKKLMATFARLEKI